MSETGAPHQTQPKTPAASDPMAMLREMRDSYLTTMAKNMAEVVNTEGYAQTTGSMLNGYLTASGPFKEALDKSMLQALEQLSLPSRIDIISLAERFTNLEMRLDDMDTKLDGLIRLASAPPARAPAARPAASKRAAGKGASKQTASVRKKPGKTAGPGSSARGTRVRRPGAKTTATKGSTR